MDPHRAGDYIPWRELGRRKHVTQETVAAFVDEDGPLSAQCLGHERQRIGGHIECGGVELHEFHIGKDGASTRRHGQTIARRFRRIGCVPVHAPGSASGEHDCSGEPVFTEPIPCAHDDACHATRADDEILRERLFLEPHMFRTSRGSTQSSHDLGTRAVTVRVKDAPTAVCGLAAEREPAVVRAVETCAEFGEVVCVARRLAGQYVHNGLVTQSRASVQRIARVQSWRIIVAERCRDPALGERTRAAGAQSPLRQQGHTPRRQRQRGFEPRGTGPDDDYVGLCPASDGHRPGPRPTCSIRSTARRARLAMSESMRTSICMRLKLSRMPGRVMRFMCGHA